jgi:hypothetical protein
VPTTSIERLVNKEKLDEINSIVPPKNSKPKKREYSRVIFCRKFFCASIEHDGHADLIQAFRTDMDERVGYWDDGAP